MIQITQFHDSNQDYREPMDCFHVSLIRITRLSNLNHNTLIQITRLSDSNDIELEFP